ncbi:MAG: DUF6132 family protein [Bacteroidia bacterium]|jgi:hypothetical protein|nr:DUF6132 family protein [Bacteroidia bacterium]
MIIYFKGLIYVIVGAILGYAYYFFIGCKGGNCAITSNPWFSTLYGAGLGLLLSDIIPKVFNKMK